MAYEPQRVEQSKFSHPWRARRHSTASGVSMRCSTRCRQARTSTLRGVPQRRRGLWTSRGLGESGHAPENPSEAPSTEAQGGGEPPKRQDFWSASNLLQIDANNAQAREASDKEAILRLVREGPGFEGHSGMNVVLRRGYLRGLATSLRVIGCNRWFKENSFKMLTLMLKVVEIIRLGEDVGDGPTINLLIVTDWVVYGGADLSLMQVYPRDARFFYVVDLIVKRGIALLRLGSCIDPSLSTISETACLRPDHVSVGHDHHESQAVPAMMLEMLRRRPNGYLIEAAGNFRKALRLLEMLRDSPALTNWFATYCNVVQWLADALSHLGNGEPVGEALTVLVT